MATIKSFSDLQQSKKLAEILPLESADMWYQYTGISIKDGSEKPIYFPMVIRDDESDEDIPCWSLAALLEQLPYEVVDDDGGSMYLEINKDDDMYQLTYSDRYGDYDSIETNPSENFVDACVEMIIKLHELNLL